MTPAPKPVDDRSVQKIVSELVVANQNAQAALPIYDGRSENLNKQTQSIFAEFQMALNTQPIGRSRDRSAAGSRGMGTRVRASSEPTFTWAQIDQSNESMRTALNALISVRADLTRWTGDRTGHVARAIWNCDSAISDIKTGMEIERRYPPRHIG